MYKVSNPLKAGHRNIWVSLTITIPSFYGEENSFMIKQLAQGLSWQTISMSFPMLRFYVFYLILFMLRNMVNQI